jgi:hypothetical protein
MLVVALLLVATGAVGAMMFQKAEGAGRKEGFDADTKNDENREIDGVLAAYQKIKGMVPSASDVKRIIKRMRALRQDDPEEIIRREQAQAREAQAREAKRPEPFSPSDAGIGEPKRGDAESDVGIGEPKRGEPKRGEPKRGEPNRGDAGIGEPKRGDADVGIGAPVAPVGRPSQPGGIPHDKSNPAPDGASLRRIEDELEAVADRIDRLLDEIQAMRKRVVSGPLQDDAVETFVPFFTL